MSAVVSKSATAFQQELAATAQHLATVLPVSAAQTIDAGIDQIAAAGLTRHALQVGQLAPNFTLPDADGQPQTLASLLQNGPVVLTFYRGNWCPYCSVQLRAYQQVLPELARYGATLVAVSPQTPELSSLTASEKELTFPVLSDVGNTVARHYGLTYGVGPEVGSALRSVGIDLTTFNGTTADELPLTATFLIGTDGIIAWAEVDANFKQRPDPTAILAALAQLPATVSA
jgi:peroxiredoxin